MSITRSSPLAFKRQYPSCPWKEVIPAFFLVTLVIFCMCPKLSGVGFGLGGFHGGGVLGSGLEGGMIAGDEGVRFSSKCPWMRSAQLYHGMARLCSREMISGLCLLVVRVSLAPLIKSMFIQAVLSWIHPYLRRTYRKNTTSRQIGPCDGVEATLSSV